MFEMFVAADLLTPHLPTSDREEVPVTSEPRTVSPPVS